MFSINTGHGIHGWPVSREDQHVPWKWMMAKAVNPIYLSYLINLLGHCWCFLCVDIPFFINPLLTFFLYSHIVVSPHSSVCCFSSTLLTSFDVSRAIEAIHVRPYDQFGRAQCDSQWPCCCVGSPRTVEQQDPPQSSALKYRWYIPDIRVINGGIRMYTATIKIWMVKVDYCFTML